MRLLNWGAVLPAFMVVVWMILRRPFRLSLERMHVDHARLSARVQVAELSGCLGHAEIVDGRRR